MRGSHSLARSGCRLSAGIAEKVIVTGQPCPDSTWAAMVIMAARATCAPSRGSRHGRAWRPFVSESRMSSCHAGWNSTSSRR